MLGCLVTLSPLLSGTTERVEINLCSVADRRVTGLGGTRWEPAITEAPALGMQFWNGDFDQGTNAGTANFAFNLAQTRKAYPQVINAVWMGALVEVWIGVVGSPAPWKQRFRGRVTSYAGGEYPAMKISASVDIEPFNLDILDVYKGTTGAEGGADLKDKPKPLALGRPRNVEPVLINAVDSVYQFSAYGPIQAVDYLYERASAFPPSSADYPTYDALVAATIQSGHWATCLALGMVRLGAPAAGVITGDIRGHAIGGVAPRGAGALVRVMADIAGIDPALLATSTLAALDAEGATNSDVMVTEQVKFLEAARRVILPCNWQVVVSNLGVLRAMKPAFADMASMVIHAQGKREPLVGAVTEEAVSVPYAKTTMAAERNWRTQSFDEIASDVPLVDRGDFDDETVYREGNVVTMPDGSRWKYVSDVPQAGIMPGSNPAVWESLNGALAGAFTAMLTNEAFVVASAPDGTVASFASAGGTFRVLDTNGAPAAGVTFELVSETGVDVSIDGTSGVYVVHGMSANSGTALFRARLEDIVFDKTYSIAKAIAGAGGLPGVPGDDGVTLYEWIAYADSIDGFLNFAVGSPGGRTFVGRAYNKPSPVESTDPSDYTWAPYTGPASFGLVAGPNAEVASTKIYKRTGSDDWNAQVYSSESYEGGAYLSFRVEAASLDFMFGLNTDPTTDEGYVSIDFAARIVSGMIDVMNSGSKVFDGPTVANGDIVSMQYNGRQVIYSKNGSAFYQQNATSGLRLWLDSSLARIGHLATIIAWAAAGATGETGEDGIAALSASALPAAISVPCTYNGTPKAAIPGFIAKCYQGAFDVTVPAINTITSSGLSGVTHTGGGNFTVAGMTADTGYVQISFSYGAADTVLQVPYTKAKDGAPYVSGNSAVTGPTGTTYSQVASVSLLMGPNGTLTVDANGFFSKPGGGSLNVDGYFEASMDGGSSWVSLSGGVSGNPAVVSELGDYSGTSSDLGSAIGLTSSRTVIVRLMMRKSAGTAFSSFNGGMAVSWAGS